jgi:hypothetical protein
LCLLLGDQSVFLSVHLHRGPRFLLDQVGQSVPADFVLQSFLVGKLLRLEKEKECRPLVQSSELSIVCIPGMFSFFVFLSVLPFGGLGSGRQSKMSRDKMK